MLGVDNLQSYPLPRVFFSSEPNGGETAVTELMHNPVAPLIVPVAQVNRMETPGLVSLDVFSVADTLGEEEACIVLFKRVRRGRHVQRCQKARVDGRDVG
jgi:hypothetical protein